MHQPDLPPDAPTIADHRYVVVARIGDGAVAGVYRAYDTKLRVWRAVKVMSPHFANNTKARERFASEARIMARLEHPNLVRIYDVGDTAELPYLVMELVPGGTLRGWTRRHGAMPPRLAVEVVLALSRGVAAAHEAGVVHRDIKPQNVLVSANGTCKLADFGIARDDDRDARTPTGSMMGTVGYMAPEQRDNAKSVDTRADVYSIGATLVHLLTGDDGDPALMGGDFARLSELPEAIRPVVQRCLAYERDRRWPDVPTLAAELERLLDEVPPIPPATPDLVQHEENGTLEARPDFSDIRAILDGARAPPTVDVPPPRSVRPDDDLPAWVEAEPLPAVARPAAEVEIGVAAVARHPTPAPGPRTTPAPVPLPGRAQTPAPAPTPDEEAATESDEARGGPEPELASAVVYEEPPPRPKPPPPITPEPPKIQEIPAPGVLQQLASAGTFAIGLLVALATVLLLAVAVGYGLTAKGLQDAERLAADRRNAMYGVLRDERNVLDQLAQVGADHERLADAWLEYTEKKSEPDRARAALAYLDAVDQEAGLVDLGGLDAARRSDADHTLRKLRGARGAYEESVEKWEARAASLHGRLVVVLGGGSSPTD